MDTNGSVLLAIAGADAAFGDALVDRLTARGMSVQAERIDTDDGSPRVQELASAMEGKPTLAVVGTQGMTPAHEIITRLRVSQSGPPPLAWVIAPGGDPDGPQRLGQGAEGPIFDLRQGIDERGVEAIAGWGGLPPVDDASGGTASERPSTDPTGQEKVDGLRKTVREAQSRASAAASDAADPNAAPGSPSAAGSDGTDEVEADNAAAPVEGPPAEASQDEPVPADELGTAFARFTDGARQAIHAAGRQREPDHVGQIGIKQLFVGLYKRRTGRTRSVLDRVDVADLAAALELSVDRLIATSDVPAGDLPQELPAVTIHAGHAIREAAALASEGGGPADPIRARHLFAGLLRVTACEKVLRLLELPFDPTTVLQDGALAPARTGPIAGFHSDDPTGDDLLDVGGEVNAMASVIAARQVDPPLAIGLFGDWGTGKTFFMNMLESRISDLADGARKRPPGDGKFCRNIVQLRFNAWHYIEQDLWASLASSIFEGLDQWIAQADADRVPTKEWPKRRAELLTQHAMAQDNLQQAERRVDTASRAVDDFDRKLEAFDAESGQRSARLQGIDVVRTVTRAARDEPEFQAAAAAVDAAITEAGTNFGLTGTAATQWRRDIAEGHWWSALKKATPGLRRDWKLWVLTVLGLVVLVVALRVASTSAEPAAKLVLGLVGAASVVVAPFVVPASRLVSLIARARREAHTALDEAQAARREPLEKQRDEKERERKQAEQEAATAHAQIDAIAVDLEQYTPSRQMATFVKRRQASEDYRSRLGTIAKARDDFEELTDLLTKERDAGDQKVAVAGNVDRAVLSPRPIDRIVLYVDDLDRCKEDEVVKVLQAVHLLLAFRLFVVVVAVDPRWLLHSLSVSSRVFEAERGRGRDDDPAEGDELGWESTPMNYLEKIFQVPFALRPMTRDGFRAVIREQTSPAPAGTGGAPADTRTEPGNGPAQATVAEITDRTPAAPAAGTPVADPAQPDPAVAVAVDQPAGAAARPDRAAGDDGAGPATAGADDAIGEAAADRDVTDADLDPAWLEISDDERQYMEELDELIKTPRAAKRFVNVYRLLKASTGIDQTTDPAAYRGVLTLLAVLTGYPSEATDVLLALIDGQPTGDWQTFVRDLARPRALLVIDPSPSGLGSWSYRALPYLRGSERLEAERWVELLERLDRVAERVGRLEVEALAPHARAVARYGFESSRILTTLTRSRRILFASPPSEGSSPPSEEFGSRVDAIR